MRLFQAGKIIKPAGARPFALASGQAYSSVDLEIGCGVGWHPIQYSRDNSDRFLIAIEHTREKFEKFQSRFKRNSEPANLLPVHANAIAWVTHCLSPESICRCFILYPNPNPKNKSLRWIRMPFMSKLIEVIKPGGEIVLATNKRDYFDEVLAHAKDWNLEISTIRELGTNFQPRTHFEKKYLARGETCFEVILRKNDSGMSCPKSNAVALRTTMARG
jgi:tRNA (guanine-N7-)-methyltransferase